MEISTTKNTFTKTIKMATKINQTPDSHTSVQPVTELPPLAAVLKSIGWQVEAIEHEDIRGKKIKYLRLTKNGHVHLMRIGAETYTKVKTVNEQ